MRAELEEKHKWENRLLHHVMCGVGGFVGGYAILTNHDFLGNAQTSNLIYLALAIVGRNPLEVLLRLGGFVLYFLGGFLFVYVKRKSPANPKVVSLIIDAVMILGMCFIPSDWNAVVKLYPIFFAMSFQWNAFPGEYGYVSSTIFSTNNTRQVSIGLAEYLIGHDRMQLHKAGFFACSLFFFHVGVVSAYFAVQLWGVYGILLNGIYLLIASGILYREISLARLLKGKKRMVGTKVVWLVRARARG